MVIASHEMNFAREAAGRVMFIDDGLIVEQGGAEAIFGAAREERTRRFLKQVKR
jgi:polar amino acid transport system ATP-binding protein